MTAGTALVLDRSRPAPVLRPLVLLLLTLLACCSGKPPRATRWSPVQQGAGQQTIEPAAPASRRAGDASHARILVGRVPVRARLARTSEEHHRGLGGVAGLAADEGMLFIYADARVRNFWMQGCLIALDIAYVDADGRIFQLTTLEPPVSRDQSRRIPAVLSKRPVALVLEMSGGWFARQGLGVGTRLTLPKRLLDDDTR